MGKAEANKARPCEPEREMWANRIEAQEQQGEGPIVEVPLQEPARGPGRLN